MARDMIRLDDNIGYFSNVPSPVGHSPIEQLMAAPFSRHEEPFDADLRDAISDCVARLDEVDRFVIEARYVWGKSFSEIASMLGCSAKSTAHDKVKRAERKLKTIMLQEPTIVEMLDGGNR